MNRQPLASIEVLTEPVPPRLQAYRDRYKEKPPTPKEFRRFWDDDSEPREVTEAVARLIRCCSRVALTRPDSPRWKRAITKLDHALEAYRKEKKTK